MEVAECWGRGGLRINTLIDQLHQLGQSAIENYHLVGLYMDIIEDEESRIDGCIHLDWGAPRPIMDK